VTYRPFGTFRLLLAMLVMCQHYFADLAPAPLAHAAAHIDLGLIAVLVFFALSGFVISEAIDCVYRGRAKAFLENRLLRIVPHFVLAVAFSMLAHAMFRAIGGDHLWRSQPDFPVDAFAPENVVLNFFGIVPFADRMISYNFLDITWAVRVEMAFYLLAALGIRAAGAGRYARVSGFLTIALIPLFIAALAGRGPAMFSFLPFFVYGSALYFALSGRRIGWAVSLLCVPAIFLCASMTALSRPAGVAPRSLVGNLALLIVLLAVMMVLATATRRRRLALDRYLGDLTYPLYLYHEIIFILVMTLSPTYSYTLLFAAMGISLGFAALMTAAVDPVVARYRNRVRGVNLVSDERGPGPPAPAPVTTAAVRRGATGFT
jgi:peptidoglycan/LPS O-acetylase OafA/YrhL